MVEGKDSSKKRPPAEFDEIGGSIFHTGKLVILDSGFYVLQAIIELKKRGVYSSIFIKKRRYWPKYIKGDDIRQHFDEKEVGAADSLPGILDGQFFHVFAMKEPDY